MVAHVGAVPTTAVGDRAAVSAAFLNGLHRRSGCRSRPQLDRFALPGGDCFTGAVVAANGGAGGGRAGVSVEHHASAINALDSPERFACDVFTNQAGKSEAVGGAAGLAGDDVGKQKRLSAVVGVDIEGDALDVAAKVST